MGAADFLLKPISMSELQARVARVLEKRALVLQNRYYQRESRAPGARAGPADPGALPPGRPDAGPRARGQGRLHPRALHPGEPVRGRHRAAARLRRARASTASGWGASCTTSGRSAPARRCCTSRACSPTTSSARSPSTPRSASGCCCRWRRNRPTCSGSSARTTSGSMAADFPTACAASRFPIEARIVAVADAFDAMTTERPYRDSRPPEAAVAELRRVAGTQLDPAGGRSLRRRLPRSGGAAALRLVRAYVLPFRGALPPFVPQRSGSRPRLRILARACRRQLA